MRPTHAALPTRRPTVARALLATLLALAATATLATPVYVVRDLGVYPTGAAAVNAAGTVVGYGPVPGNAFVHAMVLNTGAGSHTDLGTIGGAFSIATAISNAGQVIGFSFTASRNQHATLFGTSGGSNRDLGTLGGSASVAFGINDAGQVVGSSEVAGDRYTHAALFSTTGGSNLDLGTLGGDYSAARDINASGMVVGEADLARTPGVASHHATLYSTTGGPNLNLGTLGGSTSAAMALNDSGQIVGFADVAGDASMHAAIFGLNGAANQDLGTLGGANSLAADINNSGLAVGWSNGAGSSAQDAFLWDAARGMVALDSLLEPGSDWDLVDARSISDRGQIIVYGLSRSTGASHALLLDFPATTAPTGVPEPGSLALALGALLMLRAARRGR